MRIAAGRARAIHESGTVAAHDRSRRLIEAGVDVADLSGGDPDFPTPEHIVEAAARAMGEGYTHYVSSRGVPALLTAIGEKLVRENSLPIDDPREMILVTPSGKFAAAAAALALIDTGDDVLILDPSFPSFDALVHMAGGRPVHVGLTWENGFRVDEAHLRAALTPRTRGIIVNSPNNPTGRVLSPDEVAAVCAIARDADLLVFSDEIYERITYPGVTHVSLGALSGMFHRTITLNGFSKTYAMTGWRLGYLAGPPDLVREILKVHQHLATCAASFSQVGAVAALRGPQTVVETMVQEYATRRDRVIPALNSLPGVSCPWPEGAFYAFPRIDGVTNSVELATTLIDDAHVSVTPGAAFGPAGEGHIRLSFANGRERLEAAIERLQRFFAGGRGRTSGGAA
jgi:aspartate aminotransferase